MNSNVKGFWIVTVTLNDIDGRVHEERNFYYRPILILLMKHRSKDQFLLSLWLYTWFLNF